PPPLRRPAAVVRDRRDVTDSGDLQPDRLQRADGGLATGPRPAHEHLDLLQPELHGLAGGDLGRRLGREGSRLAGALEAGAAGTGPRHDVAALVGERHDRVVERGLYVSDAGADLAALALLATLLAASALCTFCHASELLCLLGRGRRRGRRRRRRLLLHHDALARPLAGARVRVSALATHGQALAVADAAVGADVHQPLDVHRDLAPQVALDLQ